IRRFKSASGTPAPFALKSLFSRIHLSASACAASSASRRFSYSRSAVLLVSPVTLGGAGFMAAAFVEAPNTPDTNQAARRTIAKNNLTALRYPSRGEMPIRNSRLPNHVRHCSSGGNERQHVFRIGNDNVQDVRFVGIQHSLYRRPKVLLIHDPLAFHVEAVADRNVVRVDALAIF